MREEKRKTNVHILIPARNEAAGIGAVLDDIETLSRRMPTYLFCATVIDNGSEDATATLALSKKATVVLERTPGKGNALRKGFVSLPSETEYVILIDGDHSHDALEIPRLLEPLQSDFADIVVGSRLTGHIKNGAMSTSHRLANWLFTFSVRCLYQANVTDVCSGFVAWKAPVLRSMHRHFTSEGFSIETEMLTKSARAGHRIYSVPISNTVAKSGSKLSPFPDAAKILCAIGKNRFWKPDVHE